MKFLLIKIVKYFFIPFGIIYKALKREKNEIIILMYHRVNNNIKKEISVTIRNFMWQMSYLKKKHFKVISMDEAVCKMKNGDSKGRYIVLTFDDGYEDYYINACPILKQHYYPSIVYIVPGFVETTKVFWWDKDIGESALMNWKQIYELSKLGIVDFGSHTLNHKDLDKLNKQEIENEMRLSKQILEDKLNKKIRHFAYPRGIYSKYAESIGKDLFDTGVLIFDGSDINSTDYSDCLLKLKRIPVQRSDGKYLFAARIKGWLVLEKFVKKLVLKH